MVAPLVIDGPINGDGFRVWVHQRLVRALQPGDMVVLDNLGSRQIVGIADAIVINDSRRILMLISNICRRREIVYFFVNC